MKRPDTPPDGVREDRKTREERKTKIGKG